MILSSGSGDAFEYQLKKKNEIHRNSRTHLKFVEWNICAQVDFWFNTNRILFNTNRIVFRSMDKKHQKWGKKPNHI